MTDSQLVSGSGTLTGGSGPEFLAQIRYRVATQPHAAAVIAGDRTMTYGELLSAAEAVAALLHSCGVGPGEPVAVPAVRGIDNIVAMLGVLLADAAFVPLEPDDPPDRLAEMVAGVGAAVAVAAAEHRSTFTAAGLRCVLPDPGTPADGPLGPGWSEDGDALCYVIHTSGTTGQAKGVGIARRALDHFSRVSAEYFDMGPGDRILQFFSLSFDACIEDIFPPLRSGATIVLRDDAMVAAFDLFLQRCAEWAITILMLPTAYWHELVDAMVRDGLTLPTTIRLVTVGGEEVRADRVADWRRLPLDPTVRLVNEYGPTETTVAVTVDELAGPRSDAEPVGESTIGRPLPGVAVRVVDETGADVPDGHDGELLLGGPTLALGYVGQPARTAERFIVAPDGQRYYRTGDRVRRRSDGRLAFGGRTDGQVKVRGYRIECAAVEWALLSHVGVRDAVVDLDRTRGVLVAYLIIDGATIDDIRRYIRNRLPAYSIPSLLIPVAVFPRTGRDKVDVAALHRDHAAPTPADHGGTPTEVRVRELLCGVLGVGAIGLDDSLIELGAHSLTMLQIGSRITREFGVRLALADLHAAPTIRAIAVAVSTGEPVAQTTTTAASVLPLTAFQRDIWLADQMHPGTALHTIGVRFRISGGTADTARIQTALDALVLRHDALRAVVDVHGDEPVMVFGTAARPVPLLVAHGDSADAAGLRRERGRTVLDPVAGDMIAATLIIDGDDTELIVAVHHLVFDGWSTTVLADDLAALIDGTPLEPAPSFATELAHSRDNSHDYWIQRLTGIDTDVLLPGDRQRPPVRSFRGGYLERPIGIDRFDRLGSIAATAGTSTATVVLAALQTLLARLTGHTDITVLAPVAHRTDGDSERGIGAFVTVVALRTDLGGDPDFDTVLARANRTMLGALDHDDPDLPELATALGVPAHTGRGPFTQVILMMQNTPQAIAHSGETSVEFIGSTHPGMTKLDLTVGIDFPDGLPVLSLEYATDLFDETTVVSIADHFRALLDTVTEDPGRPISVLLPGPAAELGYTVTYGNDNDLEVPAHRGIHQFLEYHARATPHAAALSYRDRTMTYGQLNDAANRLAHLLRRRGIRPGARAAICLDRGTDLFVALWAVLKAGGAYVPLDPAYPADRLRFMLEDSAPRVLITRNDMANAPQAPDDAALVALDRDHAEIAAHPATDPEPTGSPADAAYVIYTSGSTGTPKGVVVEHGHLIHAAAMWQHAYRLNSSWTYQQAASFSFDMFVGETLRAQCTGGRLLVVPRETLLDPGELYALMRTEQVACTELVPAVLRRLMAYAEGAGQSLDFVEVLIGGGEKWSVDEYRRARRIIGPRGRVINSYGVTEVTVDNLYFDGDVDDLPADAALPIGRPFPNNRAYVLDARRAPVAAGVVGELYLGGRGVARGYHNRAALTAERFVADPFDSRGGARMYRTGDSARRRSDGTVEFLGRLDDQVKVNGHRIELGEVEAALAALRGVAAAGAAVHHTSTGHAYLVGYPQPMPGDDVPSIDANTIRRQLAAAVPPQLVPSSIVVSASLPLTPNGKLDRTALPAPADLDRTEAITARTDTEIRIATAWAAVLGIDDGQGTLGIDDSFFALGGDSFSALRVARRLEPAPPLLEIYRNPTIRTLADWFDTEPDPASARALLHRLTAADVDLVGDGRTVVAIPYSGGSAVSYQPLADSMPAGWALYAAELPGHDLARPDEALLGVDEIADSVVAEMRALTGPFLLYGHCLGVATTVEIAQRVEAEGLPLVGVGLGAGFPTARLPGRFFDFFHRLVPLDRFVSDRQYLAYLRARGGFIDLDSREEEAFVLRNVRHDARDAEEYFTARYRHTERAKLEAPVLSVVGARDRVTELYEERHHEWGQVAEDVDLAVIGQAGHFFVRTHAPQLAGVLHDKFGRRSDGVALPKAAPPIPRRTETAAPSSRSPEPSLQRYTTVAAGQIISMLGSAISALVLSIWVFRATGSITQFSVISALGLLPGIIASPFAGAAADRWDRRKVMLASDCGAAVAMGMVAVLVLSGDVQLWQVYLAVTVTSVAVAFQRPAYVAAVAQLVPKRYLGRTNGITELGVGAATVIAPMIGVWLIGHIGVAGAILLDIATFTVGVSTLLLVRFPDRLFRRREERFTNELLNGWRYIAWRPSLLTALRYFLVDNFLFLIGFAVIMPLLLIEQSDRVLSTALTAGGVGALTAGLVMGLWGGVPRRANGMLFFMGVSSIGITAIGVSQSPILVISGMFLMSFGESMAIAHWMTLLQTKVGIELQGRVLACFMTVMLLTEPLSYLLVGPLAEKYVQPLLGPDRLLADLLGPVLGVGHARGLALLLVVSGLLQFGWAVRGWLYRPVRFIEDALPDAIPPDEIGDRDALQRHEDSLLLDRR